MFRRRTLPPDLAAAYDAFHACAEQVDLAQRAMLRCVPSQPRSMALPLEVGAQTLRLALADARQLMAGWRHPAVADLWAQCESALDETLGELDSVVARSAATTELEVALTAVAELLAPLDAFVDAERAFTALRTRT